MYRLSPTFRRNDEEENGLIRPPPSAFYEPLRYNSYSPTLYARNFNHLPVDLQQPNGFGNFNSLSLNVGLGLQGQQQQPMNYGNGFTGQGFSNQLSLFQNHQLPSPTINISYPQLPSYENQLQVGQIISPNSNFPIQPYSQGDYGQQHSQDYDGEHESDNQYDSKYTPRPFNLFHPHSTSFPGFHVSPHKIGEYYHSHTSNYTSQHFPKYQHCYGRLDGKYTNMVSFPSSNCSGRKKALLIGINYFNTPNQLNGCINDVLNIKKFIMKNYGFQPENIRVLTDDQYNNLLKMPTRQNILDSMCWLVDGAQPNDSLFFHYSGHGSQKKDYDGDEDDGYDETILPLDFEVAGHILDDEMNAVMVRTLPPGCRLTAVFDCCHSGTALDLPYVYGHDGRLKSYNPRNVINRTLTQLGIHYLEADLQKARQDVEDALSVLEKGKASELFTRLTRGAVADVVMFSGCKDAQTSADVHAVGYGSTGAMSHALITALSSKPHAMTYLELLNALRSILRGKYEQLPQLSSGRPMDMNTLFIM